MLEETFVFVFKKVRNMILIFLFAKSPFASVSGNKLTTAGETVDGEETVICTSLTSCHGGLKLQIIDLVNGKHGCLLAFIMVSGDQRSAKSTHDTGNVRADCFTAGDALKASKYRIIIEGTTLNHDLFAQILWICQFNNL